MARREPLPRQELLQLLEQPAVDAGFRGAAARYLAHLESGARLGSTSVVRRHWRLTLRDLAERALHHGASASSVPVVRVFYDKDQEAAFVELLLRWARKLSTGEVSAAPAPAFQPAAVPLHDKGELIAWATKRGASDPQARTLIALALARRAGPFAPLAMRSRLDPIESPGAGQRPHRQVSRPGDGVRQRPRAALE